MDRVVDSGFSGFQFAPLKLEDRAWVESYLEQYPQDLSGYTFASLIAWNSMVHYEWCRLDDGTLLMSAWIQKSQQRHLLQPIGPFSSSAQEKVLAAIAQLPYPVQLLAVSDEFIAAHPQFCSHFSMEMDRNRSDYLYRAVDLATLAGSKYQSKRNLISQAESLYKWSINPMTVECLPHCPKLLLKIGAKEESQVTEDLKSELQALDVILTHFDALGLKGFMVRVENEPVAFSIYGPLKPKTALVHFEKAERRFKGLYQIINQATARAILDEGYDYINREEDLGIEGMRKAKMSYKPIKIVPFNVLTFIPERN